MGFLQNIFGRQKTFAMQSSDQKMWQASQAANIRPRCDCLELDDNRPGLKERRELYLHAEVQDQECEAWKLLESLVQKAITKKSKEFSPGL